jgi:O-antigen/teichoic acid export membrane protein
MGIIVRQGLKASLATYIGVLIGTFTTLWLFPKLLSAGEIGLVQVIRDTSFLLAGAMQFGVGEIINRFMPIYKDEPTRNQGLLSFALLYLACFSLLFGLLFWLLHPYWIVWYREESPELLHYFYWMLPLGLVMAVATTLEAYVRSFFRIAIPAGLREIYLRVGLGLVVLLYAWGYVSMQGLIVSLLVVYVVYALLLWAYTHQLGVAWLARIQPLLWQKAHLRSILMYGGMIFLGGMSSMFMSRIDILMIGAYLGMSATGLYVIPMFVGVMIEIPLRTLGHITTPVVAEAWHRQDYETLWQVYHRSALNMLLLGGLLFVGIWANVDNIFALMPNGEMYAQGKYVIFFTALGRLISVAGGVNSVILLQSRYYQFNLWLALGLALLIFCTNLWFIPAYGIEGAAAATAISLLIWSVVKIAFVWYIFGLQPFNHKNLQALLILLVAGTAGFYCPRFASVWVDLFVRSGLIVLLFGAGAYYWAVSEEGMQLLQRGLTWLRRKR